MTRRALAWLILPLALLAAVGDARAMTTSTTSTLRPQGKMATRLVDRALRTSPTVRALAARLEQSDLIVYIEMRLDLPSSVAACLTWMATTETRRIVRVTLRPGLKPADAVGIVAHELHHAVEIVDHPNVRSSADLEALYRRIGERGADNRPHWDTEAAIEVGEIARFEALGLRRPSAARRSG